MITITDLINHVKNYNQEEVEFITKCYDYANTMHKGQLRQSGEPYITHPLNVAYILSEMHADRDTICAGLLHDVLEDTKATKEEIAHLFNPNVALLVDGVTKISKINFSSKSEQNLANTRKIITGITNDVRIIIVKLADRLHNMRTIEFKNEQKRQEISLETMELFVPLAYYIGAYRIKSELEDLSLRQLKPKIYEDIKDKVQNIEQDSEKCIKEILSTISSLLSDNSIPFEIKVRTKNIYGIYKQLEQNHKLSDIHDLLALKVMVDEIKNCYYALMLIHSKYPPINDKFKDYICNPKTNMYRSLHTTVFGPDERLIQTQIRTFEMDRIASFGLTAYWDISKGQARDVMQEDLRQKFQFFKSLNEINSMFSDNAEFVSQVKKELFAPNIYVYTPKGEVVELPAGSTVIDFAYHIHTDIGNMMIGAIVNDKLVDVTYQLHSKDRIKILTDELAYGPKTEWIDNAQTTYAKRKIREFTKSLNPIKSGNS